MKKIIENLTLQENFIWCSQEKIGISPFDKNYRGKEPLKPKTLSSAGTY